MAELTGVGARVVGVYIGALFLAFAFLPKVIALLLAIPGPVAAAYIMVLLAMLFVLGMKIVVQDGVDYKKGAIVGVSFWIGVGFQHELIFADRLGEWWGSLLGNGMTAGGLAAVILSLALDLSGGRRVRMEAELNVAALPDIRAFLAGAAQRARWSIGGEGAPVSGGGGDGAEPAGCRGPRRRPPPAGHRARRLGSRGRGVRRRRRRREPRGPHDASETPWTCRRSSNLSLRLLRTSPPRFATSSTTTRTS